MLRRMILGGLLDRFLGRLLEQFMLENMRLGKLLLARLLGMFLWWMALRRLLLGGLLRMRWL